MIQVILRVNGLLKWVKFSIVPVCTFDSILFHVKQTWVCIDIADNWASCLWYDLNLFVSSRGSET